MEDIIDNIDVIDDADIDRETELMLTYTSKKAKKSEFNSCLLITGSHGIGKTCSVNVILSELGFVPQKIDFSVIKKILKMLKIWLIS